MSQSSTDKNNEAEQILQKIQEGIREYNKTDNELSEMIIPIIDGTTHIQPSSIVRMIIGTQLKMAILHENMELRNKLNEITQTRTLSVMESLCKELANAKEDSKKMLEIQNKIDILRQEDAALCEKYDKIEPIIDGLGEILRARGIDINNLLGGTKPVIKEKAVREDTQGLDN